MKKYIKHLIKNWRVSAHALKDSFAHFVHGLLPFVKIKHHQPVDPVSNFATIKVREIRPDIIKRKAYVKLPFALCMNNEKGAEKLAKEELAAILTSGLKDHIKDHMRFIVNAAPHEISEIEMMKTFSASIEVGFFNRDISFMEAPDED